MLGTCDITFRVHWRPTPLTSNAEPTRQFAQLPRDLGVLAACTTLYSSTCRPTVPEGAAINAEETRSHTKALRLQAGEKSRPVPAAISQRVGSHSVRNGVVL